MALQWCNAVGRNNMIFQKYLRNSREVVFVRSMRGANTITSRISFVAFGEGRNKTWSTLIGLMIYWRSLLIWWSDHTIDDLIVMTIDVELMAMAIDDVHLIWWWTSTMLSVHDDGDRCWSDEHRCWPGIVMLAIFREENTALSIIMCKPAARWGHLTPVNKRNTK